MCLSGQACTSECGLDSESVRQEEVWSRADLSTPKVCFSRDSARERDHEKSNQGERIIGVEKTGFSSKKADSFLAHSWAAMWTLSNPIVSARKSVLLPPVSGDPVNFFSRLLGG